MSSNNCGCHQNGSNGSNGTGQQNYSKMQALSAVINPLTADKGNGTKVLLYQSLSNGTVGYEHANFASRQVKAQGYGDGVVGNYDPKPLATPVIKFGSNIVSMVIDDIVRVYGVTAHNNEMCLLSPVYEKLTNAEIDPHLQGKIAGCTNGKEEAWLYYQKSDGNGSRGSIYEKSLASLEEEGSLVAETDNAKLGTDIVAFHDGGRRFVVYQTYSNQIQIICIDDSTFSTKITSNDIGENMIELAATSATKGDKRLVYIYFRGRENRIYWSAAEPSKQGIMFSKTAAIAQATKLDERSSLDVLPDGKGIVIYGIKEKGKVIQAFHDPFTAA